MQKKLGVIDQTILVFIPDSAQTDGSGKTGLVAANMTVSFVRVETDNDVTVTDATSSLNDLSALTDAHNDWGWKEVSSTLAPGLYRLDIADAVCASGAWNAVVYAMVTTSAAAPSPTRIDLVAFDPLDAVRQGMTALPNAAADAPGGLPISDAGGLDLDAKVGALTFTVANKVDANVTHAAGTAWGSGAITAGVFAADAITAAKLHADVTTELQSGLATAASVASLATTAGNIETDTQDIQSRIPSALTAGGNIKADAVALSGDATAADNAEAFFDGTGYAGTGNTIPTVTTLTNLPAITANWLTAAGIAADVATELQSGLATSAALASLVTTVGVAGAGLTAIPTMTTQMTESYAADGVAPTPAQALFLIQQAITEFSISSVTKTIKKLDGSTTAATETLDSATTPTSITRAT